MRAVLLSIFAIALTLAAQEPVQPAAPLGGVPAPRAGTEYRTGVAAVVNGEIITEAQVWKAVRGALAGLPPERRKEVYNNKLLGMIRDLVLDHAAARLHLSINPSVARSYIEERKEEMGGADAFRESLIERDQTETQFLQEVTMRQQRAVLVRAQAGAMRGVGGVLRAAHTVDPTVDDVRNYYREHAEDEFKVGAQAHVRALVFTRLAFGSDERAQEVAVKVAAELATGADFATLARRYSTLEVEKGGDLGWIGKDSDWGPEILDYAFSAEPGKLSAPLQFRRGWLLVLVDERRDSRQVSFAEAQVGIRAKLRDAAVARATAAVELKALKEAFIQPADAQRLLLQLAEQELQPRR